MDSFRLLGLSAEQMGLRIAQVREHKKWSRRDLAKEAGISHQYLGEIEQGTAKKVSDPIYSQIARALGWHSMAYLLATDEMEPTPMRPAHIPAWLRSVDDPLPPGADPNELRVATPPGPGYRLPGTVAPGQRTHRRVPLGDERPAFRSVYGVESLINFDAFTDVADPRDPPSGYENELPEGYALLVSGNSLAGLEKPIRHGDWVWIDPIQHGDQARRVGKPHVALVRHGADDPPVAVVKLLKSDGLYSVTRDRDGRIKETELVVHEILAITPVIAVERSSDP